MRTATNEHPDGLTQSQHADAHDPERKCILSGETLPRDDLIRLVRAPDGAILPDIRAKAPGRGAWIAADRAALEAAIASGKMKGALARAFKTGDLAIPEDLVDRIAEALARNALDRIGIEARAGNVITGSERINDAARGGAVALLLHAADAAEDGRRRLDQAWRVGSDAEGSALRGLEVPAERTILAKALGRDNVVHIAIMDERAALRVSGALARWTKFSGRNGETGLCGRGPQSEGAFEVEDKGQE